MICLDGNAVRFRRAKHKMKSKYILSVAAAAALIVSGCASEKHSQAKLQAQASVKQDQAQQIALAKVPGGKIKECELEKEKGKLIWSVELTTTDSKDITEVNVDAVTGEVINVEHEKD